MSFTTFSLSLFADNPETVDIVASTNISLLYPFIFIFAFMFIMSVMFYIGCNFMLSLTLDYNNIQKLIQHIGVTFLLFLISCYLGLSHIYEAKSIHKIDVINSAYYQSLNDFDKSFIRISLMDNNADRFVNELPPTSDFNYEISPKELDNIITSLKNKSNTDTTKDRNIIKNQELIKVLTHPYN